MMTHHRDKHPLTLAIASAAALGVYHAVARQLSMHREHARHQQHEAAIASMLQHVQCNVDVYVAKLIARSCTHTYCT